MKILKKVILALGLLVVPFFASASYSDGCGYAATANSYGSCICDDGYAVDKYGECTLGSLVCVQKYGLYSTYDSFKNTCSCEKGYDLDDDGQCSKSSYYASVFIKEYKNNKAIIKTDENQYYLLNLGYGCYNINNYINSQVYEAALLDDGNSFSDIIYFDKLFLVDHNQSCTILSHQLVDSSYTLTPKILSCSAKYGINSTQLPGNKCGCKFGYKFNSTMTQCVKK